MLRRRRAAPRLGHVTLVLLLLAAPSVRAQDGESPAVMRALDLESAGKYREAAQIFRDALRSAPTPGALLGLERAYAELGMSDSLLPVLDSLIQRRPREPLYRGVQLRTYQILRKDEQLRGAFERWVRDAPRDPTPFREYARLLLQQGRSSAADSVVQRGRAMLGGERDLEYETAQLRAAQGKWVGSAQAWRRALREAPHLSGAAGYALAPTPLASRDTIRTIFLAAPVELGARSALAELEMAWGRPSEAWSALSAIPPDSSAARAWTEFGDRALAEERFAVAREAFAAALRVRRAPDVAIRAATAALRSGAPADVFTLAPLADAGSDPAGIVRDLIPLHVQALASLGRAADAEALVARYDRHLAPGQRARLARTLASAWIRAGDLNRARASLRAAGEDADSSDAAGWLALYEGRLGSARTLLKGARDPGPDLALALGIVSRTRGDTAPEMGAAFLALARSDTGSAVTQFVRAAERHADAAPALLSTAARLRAARGDDAGAIALWDRIVSTHAGTPEAAESELEWARALRRRGDTAGAIARLEHLILSAPQSALLPQARRELELVRGAVPGP